MSISDVDQLMVTDNIRDVMARYARHADSKQWHDLAALFTPDGSFTPLNVDGKVLIEMSGREQIASTLSASVGRAIAIHHLFSYEVEVLSADKAKGIFSMEDYVIHPEDEEVKHSPDSNIPVFRKLHGYGHYHGEYIKVKGVWQISRLVQTRIKMDFTN